MAGEFAASPAQFEQSPLEQSPATPDRVASRTVGHATVWRVVAVATSLPALAKDAPHLRVSAPAHAPNMLAETLQPVTLIGSRRDCQLPIPHADVSQIHCALCNDGRHILVCDLRSRMGTFVNGQRVVVARLKPGDELHVGSVPLRLEFLRLPLSHGSEPDPTLLSPGLELIVGTSRVEISRQPAVVGRRNTCDVVIDTPDVSLAHALIFCLNGRPLICDLSSRSGTLLAGKRISLAWLQDGDRLTIGGEAIDVRWQPAPPESAPRRPGALPLPAVHAAPATAAGDPADAAPASPPLAAAPEGAREADLAALAALSTVGAAACGGDLGGLEQSIALLQGQLLAFRGRLEQRSTEIERRARELEARSAQLEEEGAALEKRRAELETIREETAHSAASLRNRRRKLAGRLRAYRSERRELAAQRAEIERGRAEIREERKLLGSQLAELRRDRAALEQARTELARDRGAFEQVLSEVSAREAACAAREAGLTARESALELRERELQARERELHERCAASEEAGRKLDQLRHLIECTAQAFAAMQAGEAGAAPPASRGGASAGDRSDRGPAATGTAAAGGANGGRPDPRGTAGRGRGAASGPLGKEPLPAPLVDEPIFTGPRALPQDQWPPELRERLQVLRRVSQKSEEELIQQVWAEHEKRTGAGEMSSAGPARRARSRN